MKYLLGLDIGSSSVKVALLDAVSGKVAATAFSPVSEMIIQSPRPGFAEQDPLLWWDELILAMDKIRLQVAYLPDEILAIGISYQMHGLVCIDKYGNPIIPSIIWCDSRAVEIGQRAFHDLGESFCLQHFLNSPGNFTASKLKWVKDNIPETYEKIHKAMLPGDFIALKLTGEATTTIAGLSEGILWDYQEKGLAENLLKYFSIDKEKLAPLVPTFGEQGLLQKTAADLLGLKPGIPVSYRAGDQPNNAYSLNVLNPGEIAATAGTSAVVYGVTDKAIYDPLSRVNPFVHVTHQENDPRYGVLLCVNGAGSLNSWLRKNIYPDLSYAQMNEEAQKVNVGSDGLQFFPFGNGAERILSNKNIGAFLRGLDFNLHHRGHMARAAQEGIVFALNYGMEIMREMGLTPHTIRAGKANMFLSELFAQTFSTLSGCTVELYNTDGALGAARAAGVGAGYYSSFAESFKGMEVLKRIEPQAQAVTVTRTAYENWKLQLSTFIS